jgi:hypothetical protein
MLRRKDINSAIIILGIVAEHTAGIDAIDARDLRRTLDALAKGENKMTRYQIGRLAYLFRLAQHNGEAILAEQARYLADIFDAQLETL